MNIWDEIKENRIGQCRTNKDGVLAEVSDYKDAKHITIFYPKYNIYKQSKWEHFDKGS